MGGALEVGALTGVLEEVLTGVLEAKVLTCVLEQEGAARPARLAREDADLDAISG